MYQAPQKDRLTKTKKMKQTIIIGKFESLNIKAVIHSIDEVYQADTHEELVALLDTFDKEGKDWLILEKTIFTLEITPNALLGLIWGSNKGANCE